jgi:hypothetical protein
MLDNRKVIIDSKCKVADTGSAAITASAAATVDAIAKTFDTGGGYTNGKLVIDIASLSNSGVTASNSLITIALEGSSTSTFTTWVRLVKLALGLVPSVHGRTGADSSVASTKTGRYIIPFHNDFAGTVYRWLRVYTTFNGTQAVATNYVKFKAYLTK